MKCFDLLVRVRIASLALAVLVLPTELATRSLAAEEPKAISLKEAKQLLSKLKDGEVDNGGKRCGITCLYLFLKLHDVHVPFSAIEEQVPIGEHGASLQALAETSQKLGLRAVPVFCPPDDLTALRLPAIAHFERLGEQKPYLHYVVITEVSERGIHLFDPFDNDIHFFNRSQMGVLCSGHFLVPAPSPVLGPSTILAVVGLLFSCLGTWQIVRARRRARPRSGNDLPIPHGIVCVFVVFSCCLPGCRRAVSEPMSPDNHEQTVANSIEAEKTDLDLGQLKWKSQTKGEFHFRNKSSRSVTLRLGPADCSCVKVDLQAKEVLAPGEAGRLFLYLDTTHRPGGGKVEGCVPLFAGDHEAPLKFCVKGFLDGIVFPEERYVIRPAHHRKRTIPDFRFDVVTHTLADFTITNIMCPSFDEYRDMFIHGKDRERLPTELVPKSPSQVQAELAKLTISPPMYQPSDTIYVRHVKVPMRLDSPPKAYGGKIIIDYVLGGATMQADTPLLVLGLDDD